MTVNCTSINERDIEVIYTSQLLLAAENFQIFVDAFRSQSTLVVLEKFKLENKKARELTSMRISVELVNALYGRGKKLSGIREADF